MLNILSNAIVGNEIYFVYGLIALVVILIIIIIIIDKNENKKKKTNLFDTLNMKAIPESYIIEKDTTQEESTEIIEIPQNKEPDIVLENIEPINEIEIINNSPIKEEIIELVDEEEYIEDELDKTQAQIRVEEITRALENAKVDEKIENDKYEQFEKEQEKNAIISYNELKESFDQLYEENEKIQYLEDDEIPINIDELYKMRDEQEEMKKVKMADFKTTTEEPVDNTPSKFKSSPYISPVYGIQQPEEMTRTNEYDKDIDNANQFLQNLKELKNNLD